MRPIRDTVQRCTRTTNENFHLLYEMLKFHEAPILERDLEHAARVELATRERPLPVGFGLRARLSAALIGLGHRIEIHRPTSVGDYTNAAT